MREISTASLQVVDRVVVFAQRSADVALKHQVGGERIDIGELAGILGFVQELRGATRVAGLQRRGGLPDVHTKRFARRLRQIQSQQRACGFARERAVELDPRKPSLPIESVGSGRGVAAAFGGDGGLIQQGDRFGASPILCGSDAAFERGAHCGACAKRVWDRNPISNGVPPSTSKFETISPTTGANLKP